MVHSRTSLDPGCPEPASSPRAAPSSIQNLGRAEPQAQRVEPIEGHMLRALPAAQGPLLLTPPILGPTQSPPAFQVWVRGVAGARGVHPGV